MHFNINALVLLYNTKPSESDTIASIFQSTLPANIKLKLIIWNNGPHYLDEQEIAKHNQICIANKITSEIYQDINNPSLSKIYNTFLNLFDYDNFVIFDQDSMISDDYFKLIYENKDIEVIFPRIILKNAQGIKDNDVIINNDVFNAADTKSIGSGLCIAKSIAFKMQSLHGSIFDENFAFYYADFSFFTRLKPLGYVRGKIIGTMMHEISGIANYNKMSENTKCELGYGKVLLRYIERRKSNLINNLVYCIKFWIKSHCRAVTFYKITKCMLTRKHPRSHFDINLKKSFTQKTESYDDVTSQS